MPKVPLHKRWVSTDAWRGYYQYDNAVIGGALYDEASKEKYDERTKAAKAILKKNRIPYRIAYARTSNVFSTVWDIVVRKEDVKRATELMKLNKLV